MNDSAAAADSMPASWQSAARERVTVFLAFLTSEECREACRKHARPEELAAALTRLWFDEIYVPGDSTFSGLVPEADPDAVTHFNAAFSESERKALERFHGFYELRMGFLSNQLYGRAFFPENDSWHSLLQHAGYVLAELDPDYERLKVILASLVDQMKRGELMEGLRAPLAITSPESPSPDP